MELQPGTLFNDRYRLIREISRGSFGEVWLAQDERLDLEVAVKVYIALDSRGIEEFKTEYKVAYTLNHPNLLHAHHFDVCGNRPFLVMPFCPSSAVAHIGQTDEQTAWRFIRDVAAGLDFLHGQNIVHRDIKPDNTLCDAEGHFLITDFGISVKMKSTLRRNSTRKMDTNAAGTIGYMAPELFSANPDAVMATDIWALGASLYEMITGELPFMGQGGVMQLHGAEVPELKGDFSQSLKETLAACLAKETWDRPTADRLHEFAKAVIGGENPSAPWLKTAAKKRESKSTVKTSRRTVKQNAPKPLPADPNATRPVGEQSIRKRKSNTVIKIIVTAIVAATAFGILYKTYQHHEAKNHYQEYNGLVTSTKRLLDMPEDVISLEDIEQAEKNFNRIKSLEKIHAKYDKRYSESPIIRPEIQYKKDDLFDFLVSQGMNDKKYKRYTDAIDNFESALKIKDDSEIKSTIEMMADALGGIKRVDFIMLRREADEDPYAERIDYDLKGNEFQITSENNCITASLTTYLYGYFEFDGFDSVNPDKYSTMTFNVKIIPPNGKTMSFESTVSAIRYYSSGTKIWLHGWGNEDATTYKPGQYRYEVWYKGRKLFSVPVTFV